VRENIVVMENMFYCRKITKIFDLKGKRKSRYVELKQEVTKGNPVQDFDETVLTRRLARRNKTNLPETVKNDQVLLDENLMEFTRGRPFPLKNRAKKYFSKAVQNDTSFLEEIFIVDYSILVGFDEDTHEIVVGIIDYMRQVNIIYIYIFNKLILFF
jgi:1-phosphatidylinositol-3-phosphate 5-kinase